MDDDEFFDDVPLTKEAESKEEENIDMLQNKLTNCLLTIESVFFEIGIDHNGVFKKVVEYDNETKGEGYKLTAYKEHRKASDANLSGFFKRLQ